MTAPIRPEEVPNKKAALIPDGVIEAFNEAITQKYLHGSARVLQKDVNELMRKKGLDIDKVYLNNQMDIENVYEEYGWRVTYDKPGFNESYDASYTFTAKAR